MISQTTLEKFKFDHFQISIPFKRTRFLPTRGGIEIQKCSLGESKFMGTNQDCPATAAKAVSGAVATMTDKNPYNTSANAVASSSSFVAGQVSVSSSGSTLTVKTCTKTGCASADQLTATVSVD